MLFNSYIFVFAFLPAALPGYFGLNRLGRNAFYREMMHFSGEINRDIVGWVARGEGELTLKNYEGRISAFQDFAMGYDYSSIWAEPPGAG